jgi:hypothetical protein
VPGGRDDLQSRLDALTAGHDVDDELARMKAQLTSPALATADRIVSVRSPRQSVAAYRSPPS